MADEEEAAKYAQALRFLTSLQSQKHQDIESQRSFLSSKGLSEELITRAFQDVKRPDSIAEESTLQTLGTEDDGEAFEKAAKMFDEPLNAQQESSIQQSQAPTAPPKTYPKSPLALYQTLQGQQQIYTSDPNSPTPVTTRYDVLLGFFRSLCYCLVLGGGVTGVMVALYRSYLLPRMITTLDSRSLLLKHHLDQYSILTNKIKSLRGNSLAPTSHRSASAGPRKGVLKKVQFADELGNEKRAPEEEDKKEAGEKEPSSEIYKAEVEEDIGKERGEGVESEEKINVESIDLLEPVRSSLLRLSQALRADASASAIGTEVAPPASESTKLTYTKPSTATTVEEESDADSWVSEEDSDELEFDPYSPTSTSSSKRKHDPAVASKASLPSPTNATSTSATSLNSSLSTLNAYINSQTYMASSHAYGGSMMGMGGFGGTTSNGNKESSKAGDVAQIRADIRNLKGLLLSR